MRMKDNRGRETLRDRIGKAAGGFRFQWLSENRAALMGTAIVGICLCHYWQARRYHHLPWNALASLLNMCVCFVDVFMLLSGMGCYCSFRKNPGIGSFYARRFRRILPAYLLISQPHFLYRYVVRGRGGWGKMLRTLLFWDNLVKGSRQSWFVPAILLFYLLFPVLYYAVESDRPKVTVPVMFGTVFALCFLLRYAAPSLYANINIALERLPCFALGVCWGKACTRDKTMPGAAAGLLFAALLLTQGIAHSHMTGLKNYLYYYRTGVLGITLCLLLAVFFHRIRECTGGDILIRILSWLGGFTLELYLVHTYIKVYFDYPAGVGSYLLLSVLLPVPAAWVFHRILQALGGMVRHRRQMV